MRIFHVIVTSTLPVTVYDFSLALYQSHDVATLAAIFVSSSTTLNVFGTHTLNNSFVSPVLFYTLVPFIKILVSTRKAQNEAGLYKTSEFQKLCKPDMVYTSGDQKSLQQNGYHKHNHSLHKNGSASYTELFKEIQNGDMNGNIHHRGRQNNLHPGAKYTNGDINAYKKHMSGHNVLSRAKMAQGFDIYRTEEIRSTFVQSILPSLTTEDLWNFVLGLLCASVSIYALTVLLYQRFVSL